MQYSKIIRFVIIKPGLDVSLIARSPHSLVNVQEVQHDKILPATKFSDVGKTNFNSSMEKLIAPVQTLRFLT
jgi:hypothetical protein